MPRVGGTTTRVPAPTCSALPEPGPDLPRPELDCLLVAGPDVDLVLFDLGGVLIELGGVVALRNMSGIAEDHQVWHRWLTSPWVRRFESGQCSTVEFSGGVVSEWKLTVSPEQFLELFRQWPVGPMPGSPELLVDVQQSVPIGCLSNTNKLHWEDQIGKWPMLDLFDYRFLSFDLGLVKPDPAIFRAVADRLPVRRDRVLFLDDNDLNADAARAFGFLARRVCGIDEARQALEEAGVVAT
jgi:HAD superfamily hydrolase (TIGR01509 family)